MTSGVSRSRSLPFSASTGEATTSASRIHATSVTILEGMTACAGNCMWHVRCVSLPAVGEGWGGGGNAGCSEVRLARNRHVVIEQMLVVFGAGFLMHGHLDPLEIVDGRPRLIERIRILHPESHLQRLALVNQSIAFNLVQLLGVRRAKIVQIGLVVHSDGVHHQGVALV